MQGIDGLLTIGIVAAVLLFTAVVVYPVVVVVYEKVVLRSHKSVKDLWDEYG